MSLTKEVHSIETAKAYKQLKKEYAIMKSQFEEMSMEYDRVK